MKDIQILLLFAMVTLFFILVGLDLYAWPLSKFMETVMQTMFSIILFFIDPKTLLKFTQGEKNETDNPPDSRPPVV